MITLSLHSGVMRACLFTVPLVLVFITASFLLLPAVSGEPYSPGSGSGAGAAGDGQGSGNTPAPGDSPRPLEPVALGAAGAAAMGAIYWANSRRRPERMGADMRRTATT